MQSDNLNILGVRILSIHNLNIPSSKLGGGDPQIERATAFWILIELLLDHVHLEGGLEIAAADQAVRARMKIHMENSGKTHLVSAPKPSL